MDTNKGRKVQKVCHRHHVAQTHNTTGYAHMLAIPPCCSFHQDAPLQLNPLAGTQHKVHGYKCTYRLQHTGIHAGKPTSVAPSGRPPATGRRYSGTHPSSANLSTASSSASACVWRGGVCGAGAQCWMVMGRRLLTKTSLHTHTN